MVSSVVLDHADLHCLDKNSSSFFKISIFLKKVIQRGKYMMTEYTFLGELLDPNLLFIELIIKKTYTQNL